jgi:hypothetical protein
MSPDSASGGRLFRSGESSFATHPVAPAPVGTLRSDGFERTDRDLSRGFQGKRKPPQGHIRDRKVAAEMSAATFTPEPSSNGDQQRDEAPDPPQDRPNRQAAGRLRRMLPRRCIRAVRRRRETGLAELTLHRHRAASPAII